MISNHDNCLYIHIPKTAGQSIESVFLERAGLDWNSREAMLLKPNSDPKLGPPRLAHLTAEEYLRYGYLSEQEFEQLYRFSFVRNPFDRLVSEYRYKQHKFPFKDFLFKHFPRQGEDDYIHHNGLYRHVMPQSEYLYDDKDNCLVDYIGYFENINQDFAEVTKEITGVALSLPHKNKTPDSVFKKFKNALLDKRTTGQKNAKVSYRDFYDSESRELVSALYERDLRLFNYTF